jgi:hypothetical protein
MKDKILKLIDAYIQDDEAINGTAKFVSGHGHGSRFEGVFIMNSKYTQKPSIKKRTYHNGEWVDNGYIFEYPNFEVQEFDYYKMTFSFENQPPIEILNRSLEFVVKQKGLGKKLGKFWDKSVELTFEFHTLDKPVHYIKCGTFEFDITDEEVAEIYKKIENRRLEIKKSAELAELNKRFEKYGIQ